MSAQHISGYRRARYHLRYQILPADDPTETRVEAEELAKVCEDLEIDEVVLLLGAEDVYDGHVAGAEEDRWFETISLAYGVLSGAGISVSLNPWVTVGHADRGRLDRLGFAPMVAPDGRAATAQASFACPRWRDWLVGQYGRFAELGLRVLWLEDDFRYHNHSPLAWGGGFEPLMLERLSALTGEAVTRERAVQAMTRPGPPHPWRALMQQVWRTAQLEVAGLVSAEVGRRSAGRSRLGLMSSRLDAHAVEGRDWTALFEALSVNGRVSQRPHFAWYTDVPGSALSGQVWLLEGQRRLRPEFVRSEPEIENWPYTSWAKSDVQTWSEMTTAQFAGSDALLINAYPNHERHVAQRYPRVGGMLRDSRPALDWIAERYPRDFESRGVGLPFRPDASAHVRAHGGGLSELEVDPSPAADFLLRYGVPVTAGSSPVQALFGQQAWAFDEREVHELLSRGLLLDGVAAHVLCHRGFGPLLGVEVPELVDREQRSQPGPYARERLVGAALAGELDLEHSMFSVNVQPALARIEPLRGAEIWTQVEAADGVYWGAGRTSFRNELGGRVAVLAATAPAELPGSDAAQLLLHRTVRFLEGANPEIPLVSGGPFLIPHLSRVGGAARLAIANGSTDPARPVVDLPAPPEWTRATKLAPLAAPEAESASVDGLRVHVASELGHRGWLVLEWKPQPTMK
ncbi:hypothetical protein [Actinospica sp.]|jgi:hypothetical protein|uniref:hypothetical protein n=1 Tax=Actinospica sp. TaxID=1872142 RepID=UPI002D08503F|nr:hypothetical protein [Actinospica sp.]HWG25220.1 hypothetical protein [Actinospica sp.]